MKRRQFCYALACAPAALNVVGCGSSVGSELPLNTEQLRNALARFLELPGTPVYSIDIEPGPDQQAWKLDHLADRQILIGSAFKTFIVAKCLQDVEEGRLSYGQLVDIDDRIRVNDSPVFINLSGSVQLRSVLDAITAYSDNTAADAAMKLVGAERVRAFLAAAGLASTRIPDSVRILESYAAGAPLGVDIGWEGVKALMQGILPGDPRPVINDQVTIISTMADMLTYYKSAMRGDLFTRASTTIGFRRLHAEGNILFAAFPEIPIYGKLGNASWMGFHALCYAGQMILCGGARVSFGFAVNWSGPDADMAETSANFVGAITDVFTAIRQYFDGVPKA
jgi:beta-lactamase class A